MRQDPYRSINLNRSSEEMVLETSKLPPSVNIVPPGYLHLGVVQEIVPTLRSLGIDPETVIREAGLAPSLFEDGSNVISTSALGRLLTLSVARSRCMHIGLLVGMRASILSLGLVGRLMQHSRTVGDAMRALTDNLSIQNRGAVPSMSIVDGLVLFTFSVYHFESESADQIADGALAVTVNALRELCGSKWNPTEVLLPRATPEDSGPYGAHFRAPVRFNQESATIVFPARDLGIQIAGADSMMRALLEERIRQMKSSQDCDVSDQIRRLLRTRLTSTRCSAEDIAMLLAMHRRTLSRRLKGSGKGYREITNETRFEIARQLLHDTKVPLSQIAAALGYSEASAFTRAFRRWSGLTPTAWRADGRAALTAPKAQTVNVLSLPVKHGAPAPLS